MKELELTLISENTATAGGILGEHGLSWLIRSNGRCLLFDTGQGMALEHNCEILGIDLSKVDAVVLSHGHYDHVGGLGEFMKLNRRCPIYAHPATLNPKFVRLPSGNGKLLSIPLLTQKKERAPWEKRLKLIDKPTEIIPGVFATGTIPQKAPFEDTGGAFYLDNKLLKPDPLTDDIALYFETANGICVILGCAHAGVINTLLHIEALTGKPIAFVYGGMHLVNASIERINRTIRELRLIGSPVLYPNHCTGMAAVHHFYQAFPGNVHAASAGLRWSFRAKAKAKAKVSKSLRKQANAAR